MNHEQPAPVRLPEQNGGAPGASRPARHRYCRCGTHLAADNVGQQCARCERASRDKLIAPPQVPAEFWQAEAFRAAFAAQHMGWVARIYRTHPYHHAVYGPGGISQTLLGHWMGLRQSQVSRIETGPPIRDLDTLAYWARVLQIPAPLLWFRLPEDKGLATTQPAPADLACSGSNHAFEPPGLRWASDLDETHQSAIALWDYALADGRVAGVSDIMTLRSCHEISYSAGDVMV